MKIEIIKIWALGTYKRFMWIKIKDEVYKIRIFDELYHYLKILGVPTSQSLRKR